MNIKTNDSRAILNHISESPEPAIFLMEDYLQFLRDASVRSRLLELFDPLVRGDMRQPAQLLIFVDSPVNAQDIPELLSSHIIHIQFPMPRKDDLAAVVRSHISGLEERDVEQLAGVFGNDADQR